MTASLWCLAYYRDGESRAIHSREERTCDELDQHDLFTVLWSEGEEP